MELGKGNFERVVKGFTGGFCYALGTLCASLLRGASRLGFRGGKKMATELWRCLQDLSSESQRLGRGCTCIEGKILRSKGICGARLRTNCSWSIGKGARGGGCSTPVSLLVDPCFSRERADSLEQALVVEAALVRKPLLSHPLAFAPLTSTLFLAAGFPSSPAPPPPPSP
jgi:hypothetical protein